MSRERDLELLEKSDETRACPTHIAYDGKVVSPQVSCVSCWNIYIWQLAIEGIEDSKDARK